MTKEHVDLIIVTKTSKLYGFPQACINLLCHKIYIALGINCDMSLNMSLKKTSWYELSW